MSDNPKKFGENGDDSDLVAKQAAFVRQALGGRNPEGRIKRVAIRMEGAEVDAGFRGKVVFWMIENIYKVSLNGVPTESEIINVRPVFEPGASLPQWWDLFERALQESHFSVEEARMYLREKIRHAKLLALGLGISPYYDKDFIQGMLVHESLIGKVDFIIGKHIVDSFKINRQHIICLAYIVQFYENMVTIGSMPPWYSDLKKDIESMTFSTQEEAVDHLRKTIEGKENKRRQEK